MGKLHTLRRAIERDPDKWRGNVYARQRTVTRIFRRNYIEWVPIRAWWNGQWSFKAFY